jgi:hydroxypyruvate isomerase
LSWNLRYAAHLGFRSLKTPLFPASAGSTDPLAQIDYVASLGFAGVQDPWRAMRPREQQEAIAERLAQRGLASGCIACGSPAVVRTALWSKGGEAARLRVEGELRAALAAAKSVGARQIAVLTGVDPDQPRERQIEAMIGHLTFAAPRAADEGVTLCLEPTNARTLPGMLLSHFDDGVAIVRAVAHASVRMIFDTAHVQSMDGDLLGRLERDFDVIELVQIANHPGRSEPEVGEIAIKTILEKVKALDYAGLVELEHFWATPGLEAERRGLDWLRKVDAALGKQEGIA